MGVLRFSQLLRIVRAALVASLLFRQMKLFLMNLLRDDFDYDTMDVQQDKIAQRDNIVQRKPYCLTRRCRKMKDHTHFLKALISGMN